MFPLPDLQLTNNDELSALFNDKGCNSFHQALSYVKNIPYGRNNDKKDISIVLKDGFGTCSTKHALLKRIADKYGCSDIKLMMGIFKMDAHYAPSIKPILDKYALPYMPEAHNYLMYKGLRIDCTNKRSHPRDFEGSLLDEAEIVPTQITDYKVSYHKAFLVRWLEVNNIQTMPLDELWQIREDCIAAMSTK